MVQCLVYVAFAAPVGMMGAGWPEARHLYGRSSGSLGILATGYGLGRLVTSPTALAILRRAHIRHATSVLTLALAGACTAVAITRSFPILVAAITVIGLLSGCIDSLGNRYQSVVRHVGSAGLMFGAYGVGATVGPAIVAQTSWSVGFAAAAALLVVTAGLALRPGVSWPDAFDEAPLPRAAARQAGVPLGALLLTLAVFALYCGFEVVTANWASSYLEEGRGVRTQWAAWATSGFWGGMTLGRLVLGRIRLAPSRLLLGAAVVVLALVLAIPVLPGAAAAAAFAVVGLALAPMFPTLMSTTADRVGVVAAGPVTGWQLLAANVAGTGLSALVGVLVDASGPEALAWVLVVIAAVGLPVLARALHLHAGSTTAA